MGRNKSAIIIGTGIGGLLTGANLASKGYDVTFLEQLDIAGGRFTHIDFEGFAIPTGAFHAFPGGIGGPISQCLQKLGIPIDLVIPDQSFIIDLNGKMLPLNIRKKSGTKSGTSKIFGLDNKFKLLTALVEAGLISLVGKDMSVDKFIEKAGGNKQAIQLFDHLTKFSVGVSVDLASIVDISRSLFVQNLGKEGFLRRGNKDLIDTLVQFLSSHGSQFKFNTTVSRLVFDDTHVSQVITNTGDYVGDVIIFNVGMHRSAKILADRAPNELISLARKSIPAWGAAHAVRCRRRLHHRDSIILPLKYDSIAGIVPVSEICPLLCPEGWSFSLVYQALNRENMIEEQINSAYTELYDYLGDDIDVFNTAIYRDTHPAAAIAQMIGQNGTARLPLHFKGMPNIYFVGHDVQGAGIAAEIIGDSCRHVWKIIP